MVLWVMADLFVEEASWVLKKKFDNADSPGFG